MRTLQKCEYTNANSESHKNNIHIANIELFKHLAKTSTSFNWLCQKV